MIYKCNTCGEEVTRTKNKLKLVKCFNCKKERARQYTISKSMYFYAVNK